MENEEPKIKKLVIAIGAIMIGLIAFLILNPIVIVRAGQRGVILEWGAVSDKILDEGINWVMPIKNDVKKMDVQTQKLTIKTLAYSKDIQTVESELALNYNLRSEYVNLLWQEVGGDYQSRIIDPAIQESVKSATAKFTAQELIEQRPRVKEEIKIELNNRLTKYFTITEFSIIDFSFSDEYEKAIEAKQVAQQNALKAENDLNRIKVEAEQRVAQATAEAEAIKIQAQAITQQGGQSYVDLQAIQKWDGKLPTQMIPAATLPFINLTK